MGWNIKITGYIKKLFRFVILSFEAKNKKSRPILDGISLVCGGCLTEASRWQPAGLSDLAQP